MILKKENFYAILGKSGCGKTTLINIIGLINDFDSGNYYFNGRNIKELDDNELSIIRCNNIGFVFQDFYLNKNLTAFENVLLPLTINNKISKENMRDKVFDLLKTFDLEDRANHFPDELSGGEQQRVAIARSLVNDPSLIICDEPTGNLDEENEKIIFDILLDLKKQGKCIIVVSHSDAVKKYADFILNIRNGKVMNNEKE